MLRFVKAYVSGVWKTSTPSCPCAGLSSPPPPPGQPCPSGPHAFPAPVSPDPSPRPFTPAPHSCPILIPHPVWSEVGGTTVDLRGRGPGSGCHMTQRWLPCASGLERKTVHPELSGAGVRGSLSPHSGPVVCIDWGAHLHPAPGASASAGWGSQSVLGQGRGRSESLGGCCMLCVRGVF